MKIEMCDDSPFKYVLQEKMTPQRVGQMTNLYTNGCPPLSQQVVCPSPSTTSVVAGTLPGSIQGAISSLKQQPSPKGGWSILKIILWIILILFLLFLFILVIWALWVAYDNRSKIGQSKQYRVLLVLQVPLVLPVHRVLLDLLVLLEPFTLLVLVQFQEYILMVVFEWLMKVEFLSPAQIMDISFLTDVFLKLENCLIILEILLLDKTECM